MLRMEVRRVRKNQAGLYSTLRAEQSPVARHMRMLGREVRTVAKLLAGVRTGQLKRSIKMKTARQSRRGDYMVIVGSDVRHALVHHQGASPHTIKASPGKVLRFKGKRGMVITSTVRHPGHSANRYLFEALKVVIPQRSII